MCSPALATIERLSYTRRKGRDTRYVERGSLRFRDGTSASLSPFSWRFGYLSMGALRDDVLGRLVQLSQADEMKLVGGGSQARRHRVLLDYLSAHPDVASVVGQLVRQSAENLTSAFPEETRRRTFSNQDWREGGYAEVARINELIGLERR